MALMVSGRLAMGAPTPEPVPDFALQDGAVYRLEVGAASFTILYIAAMAFVLALGGRGFTEIGTQGLRATEVVEVVSEEQMTLQGQKLKRLELGIQTAFESLNDLELQLARLKRKV